MNSEFLTFVRAALKSPLEVSTIFPTTRYLARKLIAPVPFQPNSRFLELGAGSGAITKHIYHRMDDSHDYLGVEISGEMIDFLRLSFPSLEFQQGSAEELSHFVTERSFDAVISSLPWTLFSREMQKNILIEIDKVLKPGGIFVSFICLNAILFPGARSFFSQAKETFSEFERIDFTAKNMPPAFVFAGYKGQA